MRSYNFFCLVLILSFSRCDTFEFNYGATEKCDASQWTTEDYMYTRRDSASLDPDHTAIFDRAALDIKRIYYNVCPGDSVSVSFETDLLSQTSKPLFVGGFIEYGDSIRVIEVAWTASGNFDHYSGTSKTIAPKGFKDNVFAVTIRYIFETAAYYNDLAFFRLNLDYLKISAGYYKSSK